MRVRVELLVRVTVLIVVLIELEGTVDDVPVIAPATELPEAPVGGRTPLEMEVLADVAGPLECTVVRVSGQTVVETGTTEVTTAAV